MRGRPPLPTAIKIANGNPGHRPLNNAEPEPKARMPKPPDVVKNNPTAYAHWKFLAPKLLKLNVLTEIDGGALTSLCLWWARAVRAEEEAANAPLVFGTPAGTAFNNNLIGIANTAWKNYNRIAAEFGLTPSGRSRLIVKKEATETEPQELEAPS